MVVDWEAEVLTTRTVPFSVLPVWHYLIIGIQQQGINNLILIIETYCSLIEQ